MRNWPAAAGIVIIVIGLLFLISALTGFNVWSLICPAALILLGVALIVRTRRVDSDTDFSVKVTGDIRRRDGETLKNQEIWVGIADVDFFPAHADIPTGETRLRLLGFVGDLDLRIPEGVGLSIASLAFVTEAKILGDKTSNIVTPFEYATPGYDEAERKIRLEATFFVADIKVRRPATPTPTSDAGAAPGLGPTLGS
jgi:lia operon protein LiaF